MRKILTLSIALIFVAGIVSVAKSADVDSSSNDDYATAYPKDRHIVKSSNGTIVVLYSRNSSPIGIRGKKSTDSGANWTNLAGGTDPASTEIDPAQSSEFSICMDTSTSNIYVAYQENADIYFRKLTYSAGNWQVEAQKDVDTGGYTCAYPSITRESSGKIWIAYGFAEGDGSYGGLMSKYATDPYSTWNQATIVAGYGTYSADEFEPALVLRSTSPFVVYNDRHSAYKMKSSEWNGSSWSTPIIAGEDAGSCSFSVTTITSTVHLVYDDASSGYIYHKYYYGSWSSTETLSAVVNDWTLSLTTDGTDLWCFISEYVAASQYNIKYKKRSGTTWDTTWTAITTDSVNNLYPTTPLKTTSYIPLAWMVKTSPYPVKFDKSVAFPLIYTWDGGGAEGVWTDAYNWDLDSGYPDDANDKAKIDTGTESISTPASALTIGQLELSGSYSGTLTLGGALTLNNSGAWNGSLTIGANTTLDLAGSNLSGVTTFTNNGTLKLQGGETTNTSPIRGPNSTVEYTATSGSRAIKDWDYHHLKINGSGGTFTVGAGETLTGNLTIAAGTFNLNAKTVIVNGYFLKSGGTLYMHSSSDNLDITGNFTVQGGAVDIAVGNPSIYIGGNITISGDNSFNPSSGSYYMDGAGNATVSISGANNDLGYGTTDAYFRVVKTNSTDTVTLLTDMAGHHFYHQEGIFDVNGNNASFDGVYYGYSGSKLKMSSGTFRCGQNGYSGGDYSPWWVESGWTEDISGGTITVYGGKHATYGTAYFANLSTFTPTGGTFELVGTDASSIYIAEVDDADFNFYNLSIGDGTNAKTVEMHASSQTLDVDGNFTVKTNATFNTSEKAVEVASSVDIDGIFTANGSTITVSGNWDSSGGTFNYGTSTVDLTGTGNLKTTGGWSSHFYNLKVAAATKTTTLLSYVAVANTLTLGNATGALTDGASSYFVILMKNSGAPLSHGGATITVSRIVYYPSNGTVTVTGGNYGTLDYLELYASGLNATFNLGNDVTVTGTFYLVTDNGMSGVVCDTQDYDLKATGFLFGGSGNTGSTTFNCKTSTITIGTGGVDVATNGGSHTLNLSSATVTCAGNWELVDGTGTITQTPGTSTVTFDNATSTSTLTGSTTFYVLISTTTGKNVKVSSNTVIGVTNNLNFENITLRSTLNGATWYLNLSGSGTQDVSGVDVRDSNASGGNTIIAFTSTDSGNNTKWDFGPPEAITDLTGLCDSGTGYVTLSWSTPGDDGWNYTLVDGSKYRIDHSTYSIAWSTNTFDVDISTSGVAPHTPVSHTFTSLTGGSTYYFRIWTADEVSRWSGLSNGATVWVSVIVSSVTVSAYTSGTPDVPPTYVYTQSTGNCLGTFRFNGTGTITQLTITEYGTCDADGELENVKLYKDDGDGNWESGQDTQLGSTTNFNASNKATFSGFSLAASTYCYVHVVLNIQSVPNSGGTIGIELHQNDIVCTSTTTASSWPVQLETSMIIGESASPSYSSFESQNSNDVWISTSVWNDDLTPNTRVQVQDTGAGLRIGSSEVSPDTHTVLLMHLNGDTTDYSGHGNNGTRYGGVWISTDTWKTIGVAENILYFDGNGDYVNVSSLDWTPTIFSVVWWHNPLTHTDWNQGVKAAGGWGAFYFHTTVDGSVYVGTDVDNRFTPTDLPANTVELNKWQQFAYTYDGTQGRFYKNGVLLAGPKNQNSPATWGGFQIGTDDTNTINGLIDEVRILDRALTADEVAADYYSGLFKYSTNGGSTWNPTNAWSTGTVTGKNGNTSYETIHASNVPFNQYSETQNKVKFLINDMNGNIAVSSEYIVKIGSITVSAYTSGDPDVPPTYVYTQTTNCLGTFKFNGAGTISSMTITEYGTCDANGELENVKLFKDNNGNGNWEPAQDTTQLGLTTNFNSSDKATFSDFSLVASTYCYVHVILDVKSTADSGGTVGIELYQDDIVCTSTTTAASWPVQLGTSIIGGETTPPSFDNLTFRSQNSTDVWITASEWNDDLTPNTKVKVQDTGAGLRIGSSEVAPDTHTVLLLHLNGDTTDYSGHGNNGTRYGGVDWISTDTWKTIGGKEPILSFDGIDDYVNCGNGTSLDITQAITVTAWVKIPSYKPNSIGVVAKTNLGASYGDWDMAIVGDGEDAHELYVLLNNGGQEQHVHIIPVNEWTFIAFTYDRTQLITYKNAVAATPVSYTAALPTGQSLRIGVFYNDDPIRYFNGLIDNVQIYNRALSAEEIAADYYSGLFKYSTNGGSTWNPTNAWSTGTVTGGNGSTYYETIHASNVPFNQYSGTQNKVKFLINDMNGNIAVSSEYIVKIGSITVSAYTAGIPDVPPSTVGQGTTGNCLGTYKFDGTGTISSMTITEYGTCDADGELENVKLFKDNGNGDWNSGDDATQLGSTTTFNTSNKATFSSLSLEAGSTTYVHVILDVKSTAQVDNTIGIALYQNDIVCTSTTTASSWPVQLGTSTIKDLTAPAAITDLSGQCDSGTGYVTLSWSTPGDDGWNNTLPSGSKYIIDYSTYSIQWSTTTYKVSISTSGVTPYTKVSHTITGLTGDTTWYFQIWTRDEVPNWSGLSNGATVWVNSILGISISTDTYAFGTIECATSTVSGSTITVTNDGNVTETYSIKCSSTTKWTPQNMPDQDKFTLQSAFHSSQPANNDLIWKADDILSESLKACTTAVFSIDGTEHGKNVPPFDGDIKKLWFRLQTPLSTSTTDQQTITITISAQSP